MITSEIHKQLISELSIFYAYAPILFLIPILFISGVITMFLRKKNGYLTTSVLLYSYYTKYPFLMFLKINLIYLTNNNYFSYFFYAATVLPIFFLIWLIIKDKKLRIVNIIMLIIVLLLIGLHIYTIIHDLEIINFMNFKIDIIRISVDIWYMFSLYSIGMYVYVFLIKKIKLFNFF